MAVAKVMLTGDALTGAVVTSPVHAISLAALPTQVSLGAQILPRHLRPQVVRLADYYDSVMGAPPPEKVDYYTKAAISLARMYKNDQLGCCVVSGKGHKYGVATANDTDSGGEVQATDAEIQSQYQRWCGHLGNDSGCIITDVLDKIKAGGMVLGGKRFGMDGYVEVSNTNADLCKAAIHVFGGLTLGIMLPSAWTSNSVWDVTSSSIVGGHDVEVVGYDADYLYISSWGRVYKMTWKAFTSTKWVKEVYACLLPAWYNNDKLSPSGFDLSGLQKALKDVGGGRLPDGPQPPAPPTPPLPPPTPAQQLVFITLPNVGVKDSGGRVIAYYPAGRYAARLEPRNATLAPEPDPNDIPHLEPLVSNLFIPPTPVEFFGAKIPGLKTEGTFVNSAAQAPMGDLTDDIFNNVLLPVLRSLCAIAPQLPAPVNHLAMFLCYFLPSEGTMASPAQAVNILSILRFICQFAPLIPSPYGKVIQMACSLIPQAFTATPPCKCGDCK